MNEERTASYGKHILAWPHAAEFERGVRMVQVYIEGQIWDNHNKIRDGLDYACGKTDKPRRCARPRPERRGLLDSTSVVWGGEFGRLPIAQDPGPNLQAAITAPPASASGW